MQYSVNKRKINIYQRFVIYGILTLLLSLIQILSFDLIAIDGITPDLLIILICWISIFEGRMHGLFSGFVIGLIFDIISFDVIGTNALAKTVAALLSGLFYEIRKENITIGTVRFPLIVLLAAVFHNLIYFFFYIKVSELNFTSFFLKYGVATSVYTTLFSLFVMFFKMKKRY